MPCKNLLYNYTLIPNKSNGIAEYRNGAGWMVVV